MGMGEKIHSRKGWKFPMNLKLLWVKGFLKGRKEQLPMNLKPLMGEKIHSRKG